MENCLAWRGPGTPSAAPSSEGLSLEATYILGDSLALESVNGMEDLEA